MDKYITTVNKSGFFSLRWKVNGKYHILSTHIPDHMLSPESKRKIFLGAFDHFFRVETPTKEYMREYINNIII